ncbi:protein trichome birefringence-like 31 [Olea europaea var. sylvestris]|uniref:Trichome birefringence-like 31 n=1 Tax=Olea europaea subsp. europaea TaxID=158383 RepID=A0A8S0R464_OLEEU|nr:protein trichome birefringence-like 31 [Olea europaea var. sylvestris]CAA2973822.1 trichome birefringence-like 31 [Olea europaea subsp. europaea]
MTAQPSSHYRRIQLLFPLALFSMLILGTVRVFLDNLKNNQLYLHWRGLSRRSFRVPINVSEDEIIKDGCNVFEGKWIWDNESHPLYREESCPFLVKQTTCLRNGRPDSFYQNWRWQPNSCNLPKFNALKFLEMLRDKRLMFVGDSIQRGMFESMVCLVQSAIPDGMKSLTRIPPRKIFAIEEFNATIEYYWAPFIVESISEHATNHTVLKRLVKLDSVAKHSKEWEEVDILIFESYVWWMHKPQINATYGSEDNIQEYNATTAYRLALETWANWIESSINPRTQKIFFATLSPTHLWSWEWKPGSDGNCFTETHPIEGSYWGTGSNLEIMGIVKEITGKLKANVRLLNITQLSEFRKDGHTSVFGERKGKLLTKEQRSDPKNYADCIHWCLPGVPDSWNEILYALLLQDYRVPQSSLSEAKTPVP